MFKVAENSEVAQNYRCTADEMEGGSVCCLEEEFSLLQATNTNI